MHKSREAPKHSWGFLALGLTPARNLIPNHPPHPSPFWSSQLLPLGTAHFSTFCFRGEMQFFDTWLAPKALSTYQLGIIYVWLGQQAAGN